MLLVAALLVFGAPAAQVIRTPRTTSPAARKPVPGRGRQPGQRPAADRLAGAPGRRSRGAHVRPECRRQRVRGRLGGEQPGRLGLHGRPRGASPWSDNILDLYSAVDRAPGGDVFVYLAFTRYAATGGTTYLAFDLNQDARLWRNSRGANIPCRKTNDIVITFTTHGGMSNVGVQRWVTDTEDPTTHCARTGHAVSAGKPDRRRGPGRRQHRIDRQLPPGLLRRRDRRGQVRSGGDQHLEGAADLHEWCTEFVSTWMHSRSSESATAALKDFVAPHRIPVATCKRDLDLSTTASGAVTRGTRGRQARRHRALGEAISDPPI
jgi:hypothetical protein